MRKLAVLFALAAASSAEASDPTLNRLLRHTAQEGTTSRIVELVAQGAEVNSQAEHGETALYYAIQFGRQAAARKLLDLGAKPNLADEQGRTPLLKAAEDCNFRMVETLLRARANINHADQMGRTPLINAVESNCVRAVAVLLTLGRGKIDLDAEDGHFRKADDYARRGWVHPWIESMLKLARGEKPENEQELLRFQLR